MVKFLTSVALFSLAATSLAAPNPNPLLPEKYGKIAGGSEAQILTSKALSNDGINQIHMANFLQNLEMAFFHEANVNYTERWKGGATINGVKASDVVRRISAQEVVQLNSLTQLLEANRARGLRPCKYSFPVTDEKSFLALASIITNIGIGSLINTIGKLSMTDGQLEASIASIIPVKSRWDSFFRLYNKEVPNVSTFETRITGIWAYNLALDFIQHGSCDLPPFIRGLPVFPDLHLIGSGKHDSTCQVNDC
jgi:hypothetical protein